MTENTTLAWHFVGDTLRDGRPVPPDGEWLEHDGDLVLCEAGYHASRRIIDALRFAPGTTICWVEMGGEVVEGKDKLVAARRRILWRVDGEDLLWEFARWCALQVVDLWDAPDVVLRYLQTGDESLRDAARAAAWAAAGAAAGAAWAAAWDAADDAAWAAAWDAARDAAWAAARDAAWAAAGAAWAAAWDAAWAAADAAARAAQNERLEHMVIEAHQSAVEAA